ncbi:MAG: peptidylprolyl isomerase [Bacteroidia bacterium]
MLLLRLFKESEEKAIELLKEARRKVVEDGQDFKEVDSIPWSGRKEEVAWVGLDEVQWYQEFEGVVYQMRVGGFPKPFKTDFGYHIIKLHDERGEMLNASHILIRLSYSSNGDSIAIDSLNKELWNWYILRILTFEQAAIIYSSDRGITKHCGLFPVSPRRMSCKCRWMPWTRIFTSKLTRWNQVPTPNLWS